MSSESVRRVAMEQLLVKLALFTDEERTQADGLGY